MPNSEIRGEAVNTRVVKLQPVDKTKGHAGKNPDDGRVRSEGVNDASRNDGAGGVNVSEDRRYVDLQFLRHRQSWLQG